MINWIEKVLTYVADQNWTWWPMLHLRPSVQNKITNVIVLKTSLFFGPLTGFLIILLDICINNKLSIFRSIFIVIVSWLLFIILSKLTIAFFWNRRATRLCKTD
jgi:hypothetical protein